RGDVVGVDGPLGRAYDRVLEAAGEEGRGHGPLDLDLLALGLPEGGPPPLLDVVLDPHLLEDGRGAAPRPEVVLQNQARRDVSVGELPRQGRHVPTLREAVLSDVLEAL